MLLLWSADSFKKKISSNIRVSNGLDPDQGWHSVSPNQSGSKLFAKAIINIPGSRKFCQRGSDFDMFFFFLEWRDDPSKYHYKQVIIGLQANAILMAFCWRADNGPKLDAELVALWFFKGIRTSIAKKPYIFVIFRGGGGGGGVRPLVPPLDPP